MTWKSTAVVSSAGLLVTWLASTPPTHRGTSDAVSAPSAARTEAAAVEIQREADRLGARLDQVAGYRQPARNPFRFGAGPVVTRATPATAPSVPVDGMPTADASTAVPSFRVALAGIAEEQVGETVVRTAILSTPDDVLLVKVGERVGDRYTVGAISADAVELVRLADGVTVRLPLPN